MTLKKKKKKPTWTRKPQRIKMLPKNNKNRGHKMNAHMGMWYIQHTGKALSRTTFAHASEPEPPGLTPG